jgi:predicted RNA-binding protein with PUA domain
MTKGKIAYLVRIPDYDEDDEIIPDSGTWELKHEVPYHSEYKTIVYFEVE